MNTDKNIADVLNRFKDKCLISRFSQHTNIDPFVSGFSFTIIELPPAITKWNEYVDIYNIDPYYDEEQIFADHEKLRKLLQASLLAINGIPDYQLNHEPSASGFGIKYNVDTGIQNDTTCNLTFIETQSMIISKTFRYWSSIIRHPLYGISRLKKGKYSKEAYCGNLIHIVCKPNLADIESIVYLAGIRPDKTVNADSLNSTINSSGMIELSIPIIFDEAYINTKELYDTIPTLFKTYSDYFYTQVKESYDSEKIQ